MMKITKTLAIFSISAIALTGCAMDGETTTPSETATVEPTPTKTPEPGKPVELTPADTFDTDGKFAVVDFEQAFVEQAAVSEEEYLDDAGLNFAPAYFQFDDGCKLVNTRFADSSAFASLGDKGLASYRLVTGYMAGKVENFQEYVIPVGDRLKNAVSADIIKEDRTDRMLHIAFSSVVTEEGTAATPDFYQYPSNKKVIVNVVKYSCPAGVDINERWDDVVDSLKISFE